MRYSIDTSALIKAWRESYPPDAFPGFWANIEKLIQSGFLIASEEVLVELKKKEDDLYLWAKKNKKMFIPIDEKIQVLVASILEKRPNFINPIKNRSGADPFVVALAYIKKCKLITEENYSNNPDKPKIPNVCEALNIPCITLIELIREQGWYF